MKLQEIKTIARAKGIKTVNMKKPELIRAIQRSEGNFDCYGSAISGFCNQSTCLWRKDCLEFSKSY
ncbi:MAG: SAP domain-containing protein [Nitrospirota bacterium]